MPRKRLSDDMSKFQDWMVLSGFSLSTAKVYTSACRSLQRQHGDEVLNDPSAILAKLENNKAHHPRAHATHVSAVSCYHRFLHPAPSVKTRKVKSPAAQKSPHPDFVLLAIKVLEKYNKKSKVKVTILPGNETSGQSDQ